MAIEIGKRYENWGFSPQSIEVYESGLEMLVVGVGGSEDGGSADVGGEKCCVLFCRVFLPCCLFGVIFILVFGRRNVASCYTLLDAPDCWLIHTL